MNYKDFKIMKDKDMLKLLSDSLEQGLAENIISLCRKEPEHIYYISDLLVDERARVRLGAMILIEALFEEHNSYFYVILKEVWRLLDSKNDIIRGDAAYALSLMRFQDSIEVLKMHADDSNSNVREIIEESLEELEKDFSK